MSLPALAAETRTHLITAFGAIGKEVTESDIQIIESYDTEGHPGVDFQGLVIWFPTLTTTTPSIVGPRSHTAQGFALDVPTESFSSEWGADVDISTTMQSHSMIEVIKGLVRTWVDDRMDAAFGS